MARKLTYFETKFMENLKLLRKKVGLTQQQLAEKTQSGRYPSFISNLETGKSHPSLDSLVDIANALDISLDVLCGNNPQLSYRDIARSLILLYFLDGINIDCTQRGPCSSNKSQKKTIVTIQITSGELRRFMCDFDGKMNDRTSPQEFIEWLDKKMGELDEIFPYEQVNPETWAAFVNKMTWKSDEEKFHMSENELKEKFFGGKDNAKLQA